MEVARAPGRRVSVEVTTSAGFMPPLHAHEADEAVEVLEGELTVYSAKAVVHIGAGETFVVPAGTAHTFRAERDTRSVFTTFTPSASRYESFLHAAGPVAVGGGWSTDEDAVAVRAVAIAARISLQGPPGTLPAARAA
jgi:hypothetical protein